MQLPTIHATPDGPQASETGAETLRALLGVLELEIESKLGVRLSNHLRPGLSPDTVKSKLDSAGLGAPDELIAWFGWHDGWHRSGNFEDDRRSSAVLPPMLGPSASLDNAISRYNSIRASEAIDPDVAEFNWGAGVGWLMLLEDNNGAAVYCDSAPESPMPVHNAHSEFTFGDGSRDRAASLCTLVTWCIEALRTGGAVYYPQALRWDWVDSLLPQTQRDAGFF